MRADAVMIGRRLRRWRDERNLSGPEAAEAAGLTWLELRPIEQGLERTADDVLTRLADAHGRSLDDLIGPPTEADEPPKPPPQAEDHRPQRLRERSPYRPGRSSAIDDDWALRPGDTIRRTDLHTRYGGGRQSGIAPSAKTPNVFIFSDPSGHEHGYYDRWEDAEGVFLYCGEGQTGDQVMHKGNAAILYHRRDNRRLRVFEGSGGEVTYAGEFEVAHTRPYIVEQSHNSGSTSLRKTFLFRLIPVEVAQ